MEAQACNLSTQETKRRNEGKADCYKGERLVKSSRLPLLLHPLMPSCPDVIYLCDLTEGYTEGTADLPASKMCAKEIFGCR